MKRGYLFLGYVLIIVSISAWLASVIAFTALYQTLENIVYDINIAYDLIASAVGIILLLSTYFGTNKRDLQGGIFLGILGTIVLTIFLDAWSWLLLGKAEYYIWLEAINVLYYICGPISITLFLVYQRFVLGAYSKWERIISYVLVGLAGLDVIMILINPFTDLIFAIDENGYYYRSEYYFLSVIYPILAWTVGAFVILVRKISIKTKISLLFSMVFPGFAILTSLFSFGLSLMHIFSQVAALIVYCNVYTERGRELLVVEKEQSELKTSIMLSQIQPHFLYNSLSVIASLCDHDPQKAKQATVTFAEYLRMNMRSLDRKSPVALEKELEHVRTYVWLEMMRFHERISVVYDIQAEEVMLPALTIQPLVENAIKHGVCRKKEGGTVTVSTMETDVGYFITIKDDGVGFDPTVQNKDGKKHVGIENVKQRLQSMVGGTLTIESELGVGTVAIIHIPKN